MLQESSLDNRIKTYLGEVVGHFPGAKLLFVKQPDARRSGPLSLYIAKYNGFGKCLLKFKLQSYDGLLGLDLKRICERPDLYEAQRDETMLALVCTNGKRDQCCAKFGLPVYKTLRKRYNTAVWQCSHFGGHMYAPTMMVLPHNVCFGGITVADSCLIYEQLQQGQLAVDYLRGECSYAKLEQAALHFLRLDTGNRDITAYRPLSSMEETTDRWLVTVEDCANKTQFMVNIEVSESSAEQLASCSVTKLARPRCYKLVGISAAAIEPMSLR